MQRSDVLALPDTTRLGRDHLRSDVAGELQPETIAGVYCTTEFAPHEPSCECTISRKSAATRRLRCGCRILIGQHIETSGVIHIHVGIGMQDSAQDCSHTQIPMRRHRIHCKTQRNVRGDKHGLRNAKLRAVLQPHADSDAVAQKSAGNTTNRMG